MIQSTNNPSNTPTNWILPNPFKSNINNSKILSTIGCVSLAIFKYISKMNQNTSLASRCISLCGTAICGIVSGIAISRIIEDLTSTDINHLYLTGFTSLTAACCAGNEKRTELLLKDPLIDVNKPDSYGCTPLVKAICQGHLEIIKTLLEDPRIDVNKPDSYGCTPLVTAIYQGHLEIVKTLLEDSRINQTYSNGDTLITSLCKKDVEIEIFEKVIKAGADVNQADSSGQTPLMHTCFRGCTQKTKLLLNAGANINETNSFGWTPFTYASEFGFPEIVKMLLEFEKNTNHVTPKKIPPLSTWLFKGTQNEADGAVSSSKAEGIRKILENKKAKGIIFNQNKVTSSCQGGTCSAMSLTLIDQYLQMQKTYTDISEFLAKIKIELGANFVSSSEPIRTLQVAYNTIEVEKTNDEIDYSMNKIQSLANHQNLSITSSSKEIDIKELKDEEYLAPTIELLPNGVYLVRMIKPSDNEKLENFGHSFIYIKSSDINFFYDPNQGMRDLEELTHSKVLFPWLKHYSITMDLDKVRFYKLEKSHN